MKKVQGARLFLALMLAFAQLVSGLGYGQAKAAGDESGRLLISADVGESGSQTVTVLEDVYKATLAVIGNEEKGEIFRGEVEFPAGMSALELLKSKLGNDRVETQTFGNLGEYIYAIDGLAAEGTYFWAFRVNGKDAEVGAGSYTVQDGDVIEFRYLSWAEPIGQEPGQAPTPGPGGEFEGLTEFDRGKLAEVNRIIAEASAQMVKDGIDDDWEVIALAQAGQPLPAGYANKIKEDITQGKLKSAGDYAKAILTLEALGRDPQHFAGQDLVNALAKWGSVADEGVWSIAYTLIALYSEKDYTFAGGVLWKKERLIQEILNQQTDEGGWKSWPGATEPDADTTGLILTALAPYVNQDDVKASVRKALAWLSRNQQPDGGFEGYDPSATVSQVLMGLASAGVSPSGAHFSKNQENVVTNLLKYYHDDEDRFYYNEDLGHHFSTYQAIQALSAYRNLIETKGYIYIFPDDPDLIETPGGDAGSGNLPPAGKITVTVSVKGVNGAILLPPTQVELDKPATPYRALVKAVGADQVEVSGSGSSLYVRSILGLAEFDHGPGSGWIYFVNGTDRSVGADALQLQDGDAVEWRYTTNFGRDVGANVPPDVIEPGLSRNIPAETAKAIASLQAQNQDTVTLQQRPVILNAEQKMGADEAERLRKELAANRVSVKMSVDGNGEAVIESALQEAALVIPEGALPKATTFEIKELEGPAGDGLGRTVSVIYEFLPAGIQFAEDVYVQLRMPLTPNLDMTALLLAWYDEGGRKWVPVPTAVDAKTGIVTGKVRHFTKFAVVDRSQLEWGEWNAEDFIRPAVAKILQYDEWSEWEILAVSLAGEKVPDRFLRDLAKKLAEKQGEFRNVTDYEKMVLAVVAAGQDPTNIAGYNLIERIYNNDRMTLQGTNGPIFALVALDSGNFPVPEQALWTRQKLLAEILQSQNRDGGFPLAKGEASNPDITAMALAALAPYQEDKEVQNATEKAIAWLSAQQLENGGLKLEGSENSQTVAQAIIGLAALGRDPRGPEFAKAQGDLVTNLLGFRNEDGGFAYRRGEPSDRFATEQALLALIAYSRYLKGEKGIYRLENAGGKGAFILSDDQSISPYAHEAVYKAIAWNLFPFDKASNRFEPRKAVTRAEFAKALLDFLGENPSPDAGVPPFDDVKPSDWHYGYVLKAKQMGIIVGKTPTEFRPEDPLTRQEMAVMLGKAFRLESNPEKAFYRDRNRIYAKALPYVSALSERKILQGYQGYFRPEEAVTREMAAAVLVRMREQGF